MPPGIDPSILMELLQGLEQVVQNMTSLSGRQDQLEQKLHALMKDHAKTSGQLEFMIKLLREQPSAPAGVAPAGAPEVAPAGTPEMAPAPML
jgi:hypothetical protein